MPLPVTRNIGVIMRYIKKEHPEWSRKQQLAVALSQARKAGAKILKKKRKSRSKLEEALEK
ncbi:MAG TPA: hypothetical protein ENN27_01285 [Candidatus Atribacteria bacterium]|nr:hypothetical protein [Candidatus Atribacteria bacterium]